MTTLADKAILLGADNRPPMLEKDMYDSWKSKMELYMMNRQHGRMILESVENAIQADCDVKATHIILQGLPPEGISIPGQHSRSINVEDVLYNQFRGDKFLLLREQVGHTLQEKVEVIMGNKGLLFVTTAKGEGHMSKQCTKPKRKQDDSWFKDKVLLVQTQANDELHHRILNFRLGYNKEMSRRKWSAPDKRRSELMVELIDKKMRERRIIRNLERLVGAWELEMDYTLM
ncbi:hypothetical protein Tco_0078861 [Tanacetum coccineum]